MFVLGQKGATFVNVQKSIATPSHPFGEIPTAARFDTVYVDIVGPLPSFGGFNHLVTIIDSFIKWAEAVPAVDNDMTTDSVVDALMTGWICRFEVRSTVINDPDAQFESAVFAALMEKLGIMRKRTTV